MADRLWDTFIFLNRSKPLRVMIRLMSVHFFFRITILTHSNLETRKKDVMSLANSADQDQMMWRLLRAKATKYTRTAKMTNGLVQHITLKEWFKRFLPIRLWLMYGKYTFFGSKSTFFASLLNGRQLFNLNVDTTSFWHQMPAGDLIFKTYLSSGLSKSVVWGRRTSPRTSLEIVLHVKNCKA